MGPLVTSTLATGTLQVLTVTPTMSCLNDPNGETRNSCINSMELQSTSDMTEKAESSSVATIKHLKKSKSENSLKTHDYDKRNSNSDYGHQRNDRSGKEEIARFEVRLLSDGKYICNYGSVVIYSELPCSELTNIRVSGTNRHPPSDEVALKPQNVETGQNYVNENKIVGNENLENSQEKRKRRPNGSSNKRRKSNKRQNGELHKQQYSRQQKRKVNQSRGNKNPKRSSKTRQYKKEYVIKTHKDEKEANVHNGNNENQ